MPRAERNAVRFVRAVVSGAEPRRGEEGVEAAGVFLSAGELGLLVTQGVLEDDGRPRPEGRSWLKRHLLDADAFAAQHRTEVTTQEGLSSNRPACAGDDNIGAAAKIRESRKAYPVRVIELQDSKTGLTHRIF